MSLEGSNISFLSVVKEIEAQYIHLPKSSRIRVERWVERLVTAGGNKAWIRHRNAYARLLLGQVLAKKLVEPFAEMPATGGSLPPFPAHLMHHLRSVLGTHEGSFWRDLYSRMDLDASKYDHLAASSSHPVASSSSPFSSSDLSGPNAVASIPNDLAGLKMLIREQMARISLLEQQLHAERVQHEVELQALRQQDMPPPPQPAVAIIKPIITSKIVPRNSSRVAGARAVALDLPSHSLPLPTPADSPPLATGLSSEEAAFLASIDGFQANVAALSRASHH